MLRTLLALRAEATLLALLCLAGVGLHRSNLALEERIVETRVSGDVGILPDGHALRVLSLGFDRLVADLFWLRTIYYVGDEASARVGFPAVDRLANLVTDIDPYFRTVYVVMSGAIGGLKGDPDAAVALLQKGIRHIDYWKLHFFLGFNYFIERMDYAKAAEQMQIAARMGGPPYLPLLAARLYANAGDPETAIAFIQARLREVKLEQTRQALERRYRDLWITRDLHQIDSAVEAYRKARGNDPPGVPALVAAGFLEKEPRDPQGGAYRLEGGRATTDLEYDALELHVAYEPIRAGLAAGGERPPAPAQEEVR